MPEQHTDEAVEPVKVNDVFVMRGVRHKVIAVTTKSIRYRADSRPPFQGIPYTTTPGVFYPLVAAGIIRLVS